MKLGTAVAQALRRARPMRFTLAAALLAAGSSLAQAAPAAPAARRPPTCRSASTTPARHVHRLRGDGGRARAGRRGLRRRAARRSEHPPARAGAARRGCGAGASRPPSRWRCSNATSRARWTATCPARSARPQFLQGQPALAALRHRLSSARRTGEARRLAGGGRQRAAAVRLERRQVGAGGARAAAAGRSAADGRASCSARRTPTSIGSARRWTDTAPAAPRPRRRRQTRTERRSAPRTERYYWSQCVKDETMAESIATAVARSRRQARTDRALHRRLPQRLRRRHRRAHAPPPAGPRVAVVSMLPVADLDLVARRPRISGAPIIWSTR